MSAGIASSLYGAIREIWRVERKADPFLVHRLEYELGFREDPPPRRYTDEPGSVIYWDPKRERRPQHVRNVHAILKDVYVPPSLRPD